MKAMFHAYKETILQQQDNYSNYKRTWKGINYKSFIIRSSIACDWFDCDLFLFLDPKSIRQLSTIFVNVRYQILEYWCNNAKSWRFHVVP